MGVVYKARQFSPNRLVAIKMIRGGRKPNDVELARFRREADTVAGLHHPNLVAVYEVGSSTGGPFCSMEYVEGGNLPAWTRGNPLPPRRAAELVRTLGEAIHAVHLQGVVHRDLKPSNILLDFRESPEAVCGEGKSGKGIWPRNAIPKITDFGLAHRLDDTEGLTVSGEILGSPSYMAPEQARGDIRQLGPATDVYGLGAILYELLTGRPPFQTDTPWNTMRLVTTEEPAAPSEIVPHLPRDLQTICLKCLEKDPLRRYVSASALAEDLRRFLENEPITAHREGWIGRGVKWIRRHPAASSILAILLLSLSLLAAGSMLHVARIDRASARCKLARKRAGCVSCSCMWRRPRACSMTVIGFALPWMVEALRLDAGHLQAEQSHRVRIASTLRQCPKLARLWFHDGPVIAAKFSADGRRIATASTDGKAKIWDCISPDAAPISLVHAKALNDVSFSPDGARIVTACADGNARVWSLATSQTIGRPLQHRNSVKTAVFSPDGAFVLTASDDDTARVWNAVTGELTCAVSTPRRRASSDLQQHRAFRSHVW